MERGKENNMTRKDKKSGYGWASKRVTVMVNGRPKTITRRYRIKPKIDWGKDRRYPIGKGVRLTARHERKEILSSREKEIMKKQTETEKRFGLRKGFGLFRSTEDTTPSITTIKVKGNDVQVKTPLKLTGITQVPRARQKAPNPFRRKPFRVMPKFSKKGGVKRVVKTQRQMSAERKRKLFLAQLGV
jgi:hypothetical protein